MTAAEQFAQQCSLLAVRLGIRSLAIAIRDPGTNTPMVIASPAAMQDLRPIVALKFNLVEPGSGDSGEAETEWPA